jgi:hypothetical protein
VSILKAQLQVIESGADKFFEPFLIERKTGSDQACIQPGAACNTNKFREVPARQRLAPGEINLQDSQLSCLPQNSGPRSRREFGFPASHLQRVRTIDAMKRAPMSEFGDHCERSWNSGHHRGVCLRRKVAPGSSVNLLLGI